MDSPSDLNFLTRAEIDQIIAGMTSRDLFNAMPQGEVVAGAEIASRVFEKAAERQGFGMEALDRVHMSDAVYLAGLLGEVFTQDSPKGDDGEASPDSPASGG